MSSPEPGQSYFHYCIREANSKERARYCDDGKFMSAAVKGEQAKQGALSTEEYFLFCTEEATASQRSSYCTDDRFEEQLRKLKALR